MEMKWGKMKKILMNNSALNLTIGNDWKFH